MDVDQILDDEEERRMRGCSLGIRSAARLFATLDAERARIASAVARVEELDAQVASLTAERDNENPTVGAWARDSKLIAMAREEAERSLLAVRDALRTVLGDYGNFTCPECGRGEIHKTGCSIFAALTATGPQAAEVERRLRDEGFRAGQESMREDAAELFRFKGNPADGPDQWYGHEAERAIRALPIKERAEKESRT